MKSNKNTTKSTNSKESEARENLDVLGKVIQFRRGRKTYKPRHFLIEIPEVDSKEKASKFINKKVKWKSTGKEPKIINGKISSTHGKNGVIRAIFEKGLPGQAIGTEIKIEGGKN